MMLQSRVPWKTYQVRKEASGVVGVRRGWDADRVQRKGRLSSK